jgi:hypothetical protein
MFVADCPQNLLNRLHGGFEHLMSFTDTSAANTLSASGLLPKPPGGYVSGS